MTQLITEREAADQLLAADNILLLAHQYPEDLKEAYFAWNICLWKRSTKASGQ